MLLINIDRERTLIFTYENYYEPQAIGLQCGLEWLQKADGAFGLIVKATHGKVDCELFAVTEHDDIDLKSKSVVLLDIVRSWE
jgi:hypothetical protein